MTVYFIGAGPGAADLITVRGQRLLQRCRVCLYAGSIMPDDLLQFCPKETRIVDTGPLTLEQIIDELADAHAAGHDIARLHSGDPSLYSAVAEQCRRLDALGIDYEMVPGVPAFAAAAAALGRGADHTRGGPDGDPDPGRHPVHRDARRRRSDRPRRRGGTLVIHLAAHRIDAVVAELLDAGRGPAHRRRSSLLRAGRGRLCCAAPWPTLPHGRTNRESPGPR